MHGSFEVPWLEREVEVGVCMKLAGKWGNEVYSCSGLKI